MGAGTILYPIEVVAAVRRLVIAQIVSVFGDFLTVFAIIAVVTF